MQLDLRTERPSGLGRYLRWLFAICDIAVVNIALLLVWWIFPHPVETIGATNLKIVWLLANAALLPLFYSQKDHSHSQRAIQMEGVARGSVGGVALHALVFLPLLMFMGVLAPGSYKYIGLFYAFFFVLLLIFRIGTRLYIKSLRRRGRNSADVVIIGTDETAKRLCEAMRTDEGFGYRIRGLFGSHAPDFEAPYLGPIEGLEDYLAEIKVDQIFYALPGTSDNLNYVASVADNKVADFYYVPQISRYFSRRFELNSIGSLPVLSVLRNPLRSRFNRFIKRSLDLVFSGIFLLFYPLIYVPVAIAIKISSPGPVYFRQKRTGYKGKDFDCLKFRTMKVNKDSDKAQATENDPRKTRLGSFLRKTSLDELPQFINVFKGDMSIVGPRPHMLKHTEEYTALVDRYMLRHAVKPGITGWAQVNGYRGITDELWKMERRVECDVWYIENWSLLLDLKIMCRTVWNAVRGEKNAF